MTAGAGARGTGLGLFKLAGRPSGSVMFDVTGELRRPATISAAE